MTPTEGVTTQWPEELRAATQRLSEASTSVVPQEIEWSAVVNHDGALHAGTGPTQKSCPMNTLVEYGAQWITALKALTRCMNRNVIQPTWKQKQLLEAFETYWDDPARLYLRASFPSFSATLDLLGIAVRTATKKSSCVQEWCDRQGCGRACESTCRNANPATCSAWSCVSETCKHKSERGCECTPTPLPFKDIRSTPAVKDAAVHTYGSLLKEAGPWGLWNPEHEFIDPRDTHCYHSIGQFLVVQRSRLMGDVSSYQTYRESRAPSTTSSPHKIPRSHPCGIQRTITEDEENRWRAVRMRWALYAGHLKLQQHPHLWDKLQQLPRDMAEIWPEEPIWGAPQEDPKMEGNDSSEGNQSGTMWMLLRAFKASGASTPPPPQLMCEIAPQFNQNETRLLENEMN